MTSSSLDLAWPPYCKQCSGHTEASDRPRDEHGYGQTQRAAPYQWRPPERRFHVEPGAPYHVAPRPHFIPPTHSGQMKPPHPAGVWPHGLREQVMLYEQDLPSHSRGPLQYPHGGPVEEAESLEPPLPLLSGGNCTHCVPSPHSAARVPGQCLRYIFITNVKYYRISFIGYCHTGGIYI